MKKELQDRASLSVVADSTSQEEAIRARAYELYIERGEEDGHDLEDWFRAEEEVTAGKASAIAA